MLEAEKEALKLKSELAELFRYLERVREEKQQSAARPMGSFSSRVWSKDEVASVTVEDSEKTEDEKLLAGPQLKGKGLDQPAIYALFD